MRAFCGCYDHQMMPSVRFKTISNIKTLASVTPRISAMSISAVLFFVLVPCASCDLLYFQQLPLSRAVCQRPWKGRLTLTLRLAKSYPSPNPRPNFSLLKCSKEGNTSWAAACSCTVNGLQGSTLLADVRQELAHL